jgi:hypothetical protein
MKRNNELVRKIRDKELWVENNQLVRQISDASETSNHTSSKHIYFSKQRCASNSNIHHNVDGEILVYVLIVRSLGFNLFT